MTAVLPSPPAQEELNTAGHFHKPRTSGIGRLGLGASLMVIIACIVGMIVLFTAGIIPTLVFAAIVLLLVGGASYRDHHDESYLLKTGRFLRWRHADKRGETVSVTGPLSMFGFFTLPGVLAKTKLTEWQDSLGRIFALLQFEAHNMFSVTIECEPDGSSLHDQADLDAATNRWKTWIDMAAYEPELAQLQITVQTSPDAGQTLRREIDTHRSPNAPAFAVAVMDEIKKTYPTSAALVESFVTLTYEGHKRKPEEVAAHLESRLPTLTAMLEHTGAGPSEPVTAQRLTHVVKCAYSPEYAQILAEAETQGMDLENLVLKWTSAGPHASHDGYKVYRTDNAWHISWFKTGLLSDLNADTVKPLMEAHKDIYAKRVTFLIWPHKPGKSADRATKDRANARKRFRNSKDPSADIENGYVAASAIASEHSHGAALVDWAAVITATVLDEKKIPAALAAMDSLAPSARIRHNMARGTMAFAFAQGLPVGLVAKKYDYLSQSIREGM